MTCSSSNCAKIISDSGPVFGVQVSISADDFRQQIAVVVNRTRYNGSFPSSGVDSPGLCLLNTGALPLLDEAVLNLSQPQQ